MEISQKELQLKHLPSELKKNELMKEIELELKSKNALIGSSATPQISKNKLKKLLKVKMFEESKDEYRQRKKEKKKKKKDLTCKDIGTLTSQGIEPPVKKRRYAEKNQPQSNLTVCLDASFDHLMTHSELNSTSTQITRCYSSNKFSKTASKLYITSFSSALKSRMVVVNPFFEAWNPKHINFTELNYLEFFNSNDVDSNADDSKNKNFDDAPTYSEINSVEYKKKFIYLTADSENYLEELFDDKIYIIGGIVDRNRHKNLCLNKAVEQGIKHGKLPISKYIDMESRQVLTINHVYEIILKYLENRDWKEAFDAIIPKRKGAKLKDNTLSENSQANMEGEFCIEDYEGDDKIVQNSTN
ncbi:tRNA (guanine(9)-N(1))-methyltransferase [Clydaea vesicula]|uniref:tRNA (guanine(9)-N1)-methyltransferase n=1 Tax=Clydaea vesicula TaxID=447962 RepID=A0AAD5U6X2_9FUNG|nr:tRNA (guanine(9)-N(1))-methyltransferase [Clydaea vesicula]